MSAARIGELIDQAVAYRGYVTVARRDGSRLVGYVYDRGPAHIDMLDESATNRVRIDLEDIAGLELSGEDAAARARRSWERRSGVLEPRDTAVRTDHEQPPVLIVVALPLELREVARALGARVRGDTARGLLGQVPAIVRAVGVGGGVVHAIAAAQPRLVISCGFAGALQPALGTGTLVLGSSVVDEAGETIAVERGLLHVTRNALGSRGPVVVGEIAFATGVITTRDGKHALARPGRLAVDLETGSVARACVRARIPWLALRVILDPLDVDLPPFAGAARTDYVAAAVRYALGGPRAALELVRLALRANRALNALGPAVVRLAPALDSFHGVG